MQSPPLFRIDLFPRQICLRRAGRRRGGGPPREFFLSLQLKKMHFKGLFPFSFFSTTLIFFPQLAIHHPPPLTIVFCIIYIPDKMGNKFFTNCHQSVLMLGSSSWQPLLDGKGRQRRPVIVSGPGIDALNERQGSEFYRISSQIPDIRFYYYLARQLVYFKKKTHILPVQEVVTLYIKYLTILTAGMRIRNFCPWIRLK